MSPWLKESNGLFWYISVVSRYSNAPSLLKQKPLAWLYKSITPVNAIIMTASIPPSLQSRHYPSRASHFLARRRALSTFLTFLFPIAATLRYLVYSLRKSLSTTYRHPPTRLRPHCCWSSPGRIVLPRGKEDAAVHCLGRARRRSSPMANDTPGRISALTMALDTPDRIVPRPGRRAGGAWGASCWFC